VKAEQIDQALHQKFVTEDERPVLWHDPNGEFADYVADELAGDLAAVRVLDVTKQGRLVIKPHLKQGDCVGKHLVYSQGETPSAAEDWLRDDLIARMCVAVSTGLFDSTILLPVLLLMESSKAINNRPSLAGLGI